MAASGPAPGVKRLVISRRLGDWVVIGNIFQQSTCYAFIFEHLFPFDLGAGAFSDASTALHSSWSCSAGIPDHRGFATLAFVLQRFGTSPVGRSPMVGFLVCMVEAASS